MGTAKSGYIQRKIVKVCEDIQIQYDNTVRDATGKIYQFSYGENDFDCTKTVKVNDVPSSCNITRLAERLNLNFENEIKEECSQVFPEIKLKNEEKQRDGSETESETEIEEDSEEDEIDNEEEEDSQDEIGNLLEESEEELEDEIDDLEDEDDLEEIEDDIEDEPDDFLED
jgi:hypothetical protein